MDIAKLIGVNPAAANVLPEELNWFINALLEGRIKGFVIVAEEADGSIADQIVLDNNGGHANTYALIGALECVKRDLMRIAVDSRIEYKEIEDYDDE